MAPMLMPALAAGVKAACLLLLEEREGWGVGGVVVGAEAIGSEGDDDDAVGDADKNDDKSDKDVVDAAVITRFEGMLGRLCILLGSALPPASVSAARPHVLGRTLSSDVKLKVGVLAHSSSVKVSTCIWQRPLSL